MRRFFRRFVLAADIPWVRMAQHTATRLLALVCLFGVHGLQSPRIAWSHAANVQVPPAADTASSEPLPSFEDAIAPILKQYCAECHSGDEPEARFDVTQLSALMETAAQRAPWRGLHARVAAGEMPPEDEPQPSPAEKALLLAWADTHLRASEQIEREAEGRAVLRRLNRLEYENTVCDLLHIQTDLADILALDGSSSGFDNVGSALHISSFALQRYLEAGQKALSVAIANRPAPPVSKQQMDLRKQRCVEYTQEDVYRHVDDGLVLFSSSAWNHVWLSDFYPPDGGLFRIRVSANAIQTEKPVSYRVASGELRGKKGLVGYFDSLPGDPQIAEVTVRLEPRSGLNILPYGFPGANVITAVGSAKYAGPGLAVQWIEVEGPLVESWPPASHVQLLGDLRQEKFPSNVINEYLEVVSDTPHADAENILGPFLRRAFRRPVTAQDVAPYLSLFDAKLAEGFTFEGAVRVALLAALVSDEFLFLQETPGPLNDHALACRLSYFLWSSMPDDALFQAAESGELKHPDVLHAQVERMLADPKAARFTESFVGQWLGLRNIDQTEPNYYYYPEFDHMLKVSMILETELFFAEVLRQDLSISNFVDSDFSMLNGRLARHYGIDGPEGFTFQKVTLPPDCHRGGVLTMASVLKVTANGSYTHPVHRGVWILDRILGQRPPNPPANVPVVEPDIRGAKGIRDLLAKHRTGNCASCHALIDPPGFALESFDVIGGWRDRYRTTGMGDEVTINGQTMSYLHGPAVECADVLADGRAFSNMDEFKKLLLNDREQIAKTVCRQLVTYATGAPPEVIDEDAIQAIVTESAGADHGLRTMVHAIVRSPLFQNK